MRPPNKNNPYHCNKPMRRNGKTKAGAQQYRCDCGHTCVDSAYTWGGVRLSNQPKERKTKAAATPKKRGRPKKVKDE